MGECESCHSAEERANEYTLKKPDMTRKVKLCDACADHYRTAGHTLTGGKAEAKPTPEADEEKAAPAEEKQPTPTRRKA